MRTLRVSVPAITIATGIVALVACTTSSRNADERAGTTGSAIRTVTEVPGSPGCPQGTMLVCRVDIGTHGGSECTPPMVITPMGGGSAFFWMSPSGQLIDAVVVNGVDRANVYDYSPPVSSDSDLLFPPPIDGGGPRLSRIDFCVARDRDAGPGDAGDATGDAPADAPSDARGPKMW
jgi:hypothetical protein